MNGEPGLIFKQLDRNAWDAADSTWLADVGRVLRALNTYMSGEIRFAQADPHAGMVPDRVGDLGRSLVAIGEQMQEDARTRSAYMADFGVPLLQYLATLAPGNRVTGRHLCEEIGVFNGGVESALMDLSRSGAVDTDRPPVGGTIDTTTYALTEEGRVLITVPVIAPTPIRIERGDGA